MVNLSLSDFSSICRPLVLTSRFLTSRAVREELSAYLDETAQQTCRKILPIWESIIEKHAILRNGTLLLGVVPFAFHVRLMNRVLSNLPEGSIEVSYILSLISPDMNTLEKIERCQAVIFGLDDNEREEIIHCALQLTNPDMTIPSRMLIHNAIVELPWDQRQEIVTFALQNVITSHSSVSAKVKICSGMAHLSKETRAEVVRLMQQLPTEGMSCDERVEIYVRIAGLSRLEDKKRVVAAALASISRGPSVINASDRFRIILAHLSSSRPRI